MISVEGQYYFSANLSDEQDIVTPENFESFTLIEQAGNVLPTFAFIFTAKTDRYLSKLNEGSKLKVQIGKDFDSASDASLAVSKFTSSRKGRTERQYVCKGFLDKTKYHTDAGFLITDSVSGIEAVKQVVSKNFQPVFNIDKSLDSQKWIQHGNNDRDFVNKTIMHSYAANNSFYATAITADNKFIVKDIKKEAKDRANNYQYILANISSTDPRVLNYNSDFEIQSSTGFMNNFVGYGREQLVYDLEKGTETSVLETPDPVVALTREIARKADIEKKFVGSAMQNRNTHSNYWRAYQNNLNNLAMMSSVKVIVTVPGFTKIRPLDLVMFKDFSVENETESAEFQSGVYIVTKTIKTISGNDFNTTLELVRESFNQIRNDSVN